MVVSATISSNHQFISTLFAWTIHTDAAQVEVVHKF